MNRIILFILLCCIRQLLAEKPTASIYTDFNRNLMVSPQSAALSGADLSINEGALPGYSPANLSRDSLNALSLSYANYFGNTFSTSTLSYVNHIDSNIAFGVAAGYIFIPDIEDNRDLDTNEYGDPRFNKSIKITNCSHIYFRTGYGITLNSGKPIEFSSGISLNASRIRLIDYNGYGLSLDLGSGVQFIKPGISLMVLVENIFGSYTYWNSLYSESGFRHIRIGLGWEQSFEYLYGEIRIGYTSPDLLTNEGINYISIDEHTDDFYIEKLNTYKIYEKPSILFSSAKFGIEYKILNIVAIRGGVANRRLSFGAGLELFAQRAGIDFAYLRHALSGTYQISLSYKW